MTVVSSRYYGFSLLRTPNFDHEGVPSSTIWLYYIIIFSFNNYLSCRHVIFHFIGKSHYSLLQVEIKMVMSHSLCSQLYGEGNAWIYLIFLKKSHSSFHGGGCKFNNWLVDNEKGLHNITRLYMEYLLTTCIINQTICQSVFFHSSKLFSMIMSTVNNRQSVSHSINFPINHSTTI